MVDRIILYVKLADAKALGKPRAPHERREAGMKSRLWLAGNRQQLAVPPQILRPSRNVLACQRDSRIVVHRLERAQASIADVDGLGGKRRLAHVTLQSDECGHTASANFWSGRPWIVSGSVRIGAGTIAARSRAMAMRSPSAATAVASPPVPTPVKVISPANSPVMIATFSGPTARASSDSRGTKVGATHATRGDGFRRYSAWAIW